MSNSTLAVTDTRVVNFYNHYHSKVVTNPSLYQGTKQVNVVLPADLLEYANAAAGHSGFGTGARAVGIRRACDDPAAYLAEVFDTHASLAQFINDSECDAAAYIESIRSGAKPVAKRRTSIDLAAIAAAGNMYSFFAGDDVRSLAVKLGGAEAFQAYLATRSIADVVAEQGLEVKEGAKAPVAKKATKSAINYSLGF